MSKDQKILLAQPNKWVSKDNIIPNQHASLPEILLTNQSSIEGVSEFAKSKRKQAVEPDNSACSINGIPQSKRRRYPADQLMFKRRMPNGAYGLVRGQTVN